MKNLQIYKSAIAGLSLASIALFSGCSLDSTEAKTSTPDEISTKCSHLTIYFEDQPITFKQCEGYDINIVAYSHGGHMQYSVSEDGKKIIYEGITTLANYYEVYHEVADEILDNESVQKTR